MLTDDHMRHGRSGIACSTRLGRPAVIHRRLTGSDTLPPGIGAVRYLQRVLRGMLLTAIEVDDPDFPVLVRLFDTYLPYGNSNPDCTYFHATVSPRHTYRISGKRGTARIVEVQVMDGHFVAGPNHKSLGTLPDIQPDATAISRSR